MKKIEFIESYRIPDDGGDYQWDDNHGRLIRCKDCRWKQGSECVRFADVRPLPDDFCSRAELRGEQE